MTRLKLLYLTFGVVIGTVFGLIVTAAVTRSGPSESGPVQITEEEHDHSAHGTGTPDASDNSGHHKQQAGMREGDTAKMHTESNGGMTKHHGNQGDSADSTIRAGPPGHSAQEGQHGNHTH